MGLEFRTFDSRLNLDMSVYRKNTVDEILNVSVSNTSGFSGTKVNIGKLQNKGIEFLLTVVPVRADNISWETSFNASYNISKVLSLVIYESQIYQYVVCGMANISSFPCYNIGAESLSTDSVTQPRRRRVTAP